MSLGGLGSALWRGIAPWLRAIVYGSALGLLIAAAQRAGLWSALAARLSPLVFPMLALGLRVVWLWTRAQRSRRGHGALGRGARPELAEIARIFLVLGLAGTLWQLDGALGDGPRALGELARTLLPALLGAGLQIATWRVAAQSPTWSLARVTRSGERELYRLDRALLGEGEHGLAALLEALEAHPPEALRLDLDPLLADERCTALQARIARSMRGPLERTPPLPGTLAPLWSEVLGAVGAAACLELASAVPQGPEIA